MPRVKKTVNEDESLRWRIESYYLQGVPPFQICKSLKITPKTYKEVLDESKDRWRQRNEGQYKTILVEQLAKVDEVESEAWRAWRDSREGRKVPFERVEKALKNVIDSTHNPKKGEEPRTKPELVVVKVVNEMRQVVGEGSVQFLSVIQWCVETRLKVIGALSPEKTTVNVFVGDRSEKKDRTWYDDLLDASKDGKDPVNDRLVEIETKSKILPDEDGVRRYE